MNIKKKRSFTAVLTLLALAITHSYSTDAVGAPRNAADAETLAQQTLSQMTLEEKLNYIGGTGGWDVKPLPRFGLPQIFGADGGLGVRYTSQGNDQGVVYPGGPNLAATFNPHRAVDFGRALGYDTATGGYHYITGPGMNMYRMPYGGRNFEYVSGEDPYLGASLAPGVINGVQSRGIWADAKHYTANDQESDRFTLNETISERVLREITLPPFESSSKNGKVALMMCSFQLVNGDHACESSHLLKDIMKSDWGYQGFVQTDYNAIVNGLKAAQAGADIDMLAGSQMNSANLTPYIDSGELKVATIDDKVLRILRQIYLFGFDTYVPSTAHDMASVASNQASLSVAREGVVLLKNKDNFLPLNSASVKSIAVIGTLGKYAPPIGFGSAFIAARFYISELSGLKQVAPNANVVFLDTMSLDPIAAKWTFLDDSGASVAGIKAEYFTNATWSGTPAVSRNENVVNLNWDSDPNLPTNGDTASTSARWTGQVTPTITGEHVFKVRADGVYTLTVNGIEVLNNGAGTPFPGFAIPPTIPQSGKVTLQAGQTYDVKLEYSRRPGYIASLGGYVGVQMSWASLVAPSDLASYDAVVVAAGNSNEYEGEGFDHPFELPEFQGQMIQSVAQANPHTIVTLFGGTGLKMSDWNDQVAGAIHAFYPGQNGGQALAEIIFGRANPSGKLPLSIERNLEDNPVYSSFPVFDNLGSLVAMTYSNDLFLGYRGYDKSGVKPLYPFGYGLSYTTFRYSNIRVTPPIVIGNAPIRVSFDVTNTGSRAGAEASEIYVGERSPRVTRPVKELKAYKKLLYQPGQTRRVSVQLNARSLAYYSPRRAAWVVDANLFNILVGSSSEDIRLSALLINPFSQELSVGSSNPLAPDALRATQVTDRIPPTGTLYDQEDAGDVDTGGNGPY